MELVPVPHCHASRPNLLCCQLCNVVLCPEQPGTTCLCTSGSVIHQHPPVVACMATRFLRAVPLVSVGMVQPSSRKLRRVGLLSSSCWPGVQADMDSPVIRLVYIYVSSLRPVRLSSSPAFSAPGRSLAAMQTDTSMLYVRASVSWFGRSCTKRMA